jgi:hypothetical protein
MAGRNGLWLACIVTGLIGAVTPALAHHGTGASYDQKKWVTVKGTVTEFWWRNPHSALFMDVKDEKGEVVKYSIELNSPGLMVKAGLTRDSFKVGDQVEIDVHPSLAGEPVGECLGCRMLVNGKDPKQSQ